MQQLVGRELAAPFPHRDNYSIYIFAIDNALEIRSNADNSWVNQALAEKLRVRAHETHDSIAGIRPVQYLASYFDSKITRAHNQNPLTEVRVAKKPMDRHAPGDHQGERQWQRNKRDASSQLQVGK